VSQSLESGPEAAERDPQRRQAVRRSRDIGRKQRHHAFTAAAPMHRGRSRSVLASVCARAPSRPAVRRFARRAPGVHGNAVPGEVSQTWSMRVHRSVRGGRGRSSGPARRRTAMLSAVQTIIVFAQVALYLKSMRMSALRNRPSAFARRERPRSPLKDLRPIT